MADPIWHWESLQTLPYSFIQEFVEHQIKARQTQQNVSQYAIAHYAADKLSSKNKRYQATDFLPWSTDSKEKPKTLSQKTLSQKTLSTLRKLVDTGELPAQAEAAARARLK